ncbi:cell division protein FtsL [Heyndrickxia acidiproducens]|uniref:cell division protein FtsL n=1 Tax=Heyndrickxia acidiproducens TaxID=1121084 RepID=UPI000365E81E|nr:cell division protein FtsL [Heyndrickxia acidiproducens]
MSNLARQPKTSSETQTQKQVEVQQQPLKRRAQITLGEKIIASIFALFVVFMAVKIISTEAAIYNVNKSIEDTKTTINSKNKAVDDLKMQVSDLSRYDRIYKKAKELGLKLDENNVKVVENK